MALRFQSAPIQTSTGFAPSISRYASSKFNFLRFSRSPNFSQTSQMAKGSRSSPMPHCQAIHTTDLQNVIVAHSSQPGQLVIISRDLHRHETDIGYLSYTLSEQLSKLVLADLDSSTAKLAIGLLGPLLSGFGFLFILRIIMSWYPKLPVGKFPYVIAYAPTEPLLSPTRKLIQPVGGVDVTPVVWFAIISFLNEILVGPQGLLVLLSQKV
ncbi:hypothetical protein MRB53_014722 [Persea americana]|uniref:Uncharacterized protein n=1 Tax=Persea americana TaxID=3435 RepID=A0ACC2KBR6_PERAE|nr:hypothetical protein MRB53_014722 [Persea americana]